MPPPTQNAQRQSLPSGEGGPTRRTLRPYSSADIFILFASRE